MTLTTLEDGVAELLANPLEQTVHRQIVDRVMDECADPRRALLDLVLTHKASDGPRLAFAQWCEATGDGERAEFIRLQCAGGYEPDWARGKPRVRKGHGYLRTREQELHDVAFLPSPKLVGWDDGVVCYSFTSPAVNRVDVLFKRGFAEQIWCKAADFLAHADAILSEHPVEWVRLSTVPEVEHDPLNDDRYHYPVMWLKGRSLRHDVPLGRPIGHPEWAKTLLKAEFPGVEFELPPANSSWAASPSEASPLADILAMRERLLAPYKPPIGPILFKTTG